jgi:hypothetical protein
MPGWRVSRSTRCRSPRCGVRKEVSLEKLCVYRSCIDVAAAVLTSAFEHRRSAAVVVTGPCLQRSVQLVDKVLAQFTEESSPGEESRRRGGEDSTHTSVPSRTSPATPAFSVARVRGLAGGEAGADERHALLDLARSLGLVLQSTNMTVSLEALHEYFKVICAPLAVITTFPSSNSLRIRACSTGRCPPCPRC